MGKRFLVAVIVIMIVSVATLAVLGMNGLHNGQQPTPTQTPSPTASPSPMPTLTPSPTPSPTPELKTTWFDFVSLDTANTPEIRGYLTRGGWNNGCIPGATIEIVDSVNGTVYGQTTTLSEMDLGRNLNVGGFSFTLPSTNGALSVQAVFHGDSEWKGCSSIVVTYDPSNNVRAFSPLN